MICEVCKKEFTVKARPNMSTLCSLECHEKLNQLLNETLDAMKKYAHKHPEKFWSDEPFHTLK